jgi:hypothetical protein
MAVLLLGFFGLLFAQYRNIWVYNQRIKLIHTSFDTYDDYLSYNEMMHKFWVWDIEKLKKNK